LWLKDNSKSHYFNPLFRLFFQKKTEKVRNKKLKQENPPSQHPPLPKRKRNDMAKYDRDEERRRKKE
jgi:hypothetical protein